MRNLTNSLERGFAESLSLWSLTFETKAPHYRKHFQEKRDKGLHISTVVSGSRFEETKLEFIRIKTNLPREQRTQKLRERERQRNAAFCHTSTGAFTRFHTTSRRKLNYERPRCRVTRLTAFESRLAMPGDCSSAQHYSFHLNPLGGPTTTVEEPLQREIVRHFAP